MAPIGWPVYHFLLLTQWAPSRATFGSLYTVITAHIVHRSWLSQGSHWLGVTAVWPIAIIHLHWINAFACITILRWHPNGWTCPASWTYRCSFGIPPNPLSPKNCQSVNIMVHLQARRTTNIQSNSQPSIVWAIGCIKCPNVGNSTCPQFKNVTMH